MRIFNKKNFFKLFFLNFLIIVILFNFAKAQENRETLWRAYYYCNGFNECLSILNKIENDLKISNGNKEEFDYLYYEKATHLSKSDNKEHILNAEKLYLEIINDSLLKKNPNSIFYYSHANLGWLYHTETVVFKPKIAIDLMTVAAEQNIPTAINNLGAFYEMGLGTKKDYNKSLELYFKASKLGNHWAHANIAKFYMLGHGGAKKNYNKAINHLKLATISEYGKNDNYLLKLLLNRKKLPKNIKEFNEWMKQEAIKNKDVNSFKILGFENDYSQKAFYWFYLCSEYSKIQSDIKRCNQEMKIIKRIIPNELTIEKLEIIKNDALNWYKQNFKEST